MLHLRRYSEVWPDSSADWHDSQFAVLNDQGCHIGRILRVHAPGGTYAWQWYLNGESKILEASGRRDTKEGARAEFAARFRNYLADNGFPEDYCPRYSKPMAPKERRRLGLPG